MFPYSSGPTKPHIDHIFLSLLGSNELVVRNIAFLSTIEELKEKIPAMWPGGATSEATQTEWRIRFAGSPWSATGLEAVLYVRFHFKMRTVLAFLTVILS